MKLFLFYENQIAINKIYIVHHFHTHGHPTRKNRQTPSATTSHPRSSLGACKGEILDAATRSPDSRYNKPLFSRAPGAPTAINFPARAWQLVIIRYGPLRGQSSVDRDKQIFPGPPFLRRAPARSGRRKFSSAAVHGRLSAPKLRSLGAEPRAASPYRAAGFPITQFALERGRARRDATRSIDH